MASNDAHYSPTLIPRQNTTEKSNYKCKEEARRLESGVRAKEVRKDALDETLSGRLSGSPCVSLKRVGQAASRIKGREYQALCYSKAKGKIVVLPMQIHVLQLLLQAR